ncbi:hypothetical protein [Paenibacillus alkalitolerans]|nr:hypothetical protein [Paenibacillus alkalitolerans]
MIEPPLWFWIMGIIILGIACVLEVRERKIMKDKKTSFDANSEKQDRV